MKHRHSPAAHGRIRREGFTLIEVTVALVACAVGLTALMMVLGHALRVNRRSVDETRVAILHQTVIRDIRSQPYSSVVIAGQTINLGSSTTKSWMFDRELLPTGDASPTRYYQLVLNSNPTNFTDMSYISISVMWPATANPPLYTNSIHTWVADKD
jgi:prepilin-type N-terminal cleavage/methylation domain-containing protein